MIRNKYSTPKGDRLMGGIFIVQQLRNRYSENGGFLTPFANPPSGGGLATEFAILIPESKILEKAPQNLYDTIISVFEEANATNSWLGDENFAIDAADIDTELGTEVADGWNAGWDDQG